MNLGSSRYEVILGQKTKSIFALFPWVGTGGVEL